MFILNYKYKSSSFEVIYKIVVPERFTKIHKKATAIGSFV